MSPEIRQVARRTQAEHIVAWVEANLGGAVVGLQRLPRWRAGWHLDVAVGDRILELYARGERGPDFPSPFSLAHEAAVHALLEANGIPVAHVHGLVDEGPVRSLLMDRLPGQQGLALAAPHRQGPLLEEAIRQMVRMHSIGPHELRRHGFEVPQTAEDIAMSEVFRKVRRAYLLLDRPDPTIEFLVGWLRRNLPGGRLRPAFVAWDSAQFLHDRGELVALIDFELAHVGDPYMDLAALRTRDSMEPLGDLGVAFDTFARLTGEPIDVDVLRYYEISQLTATMMLQYPVLCEPDPASDYVTHLTWYTESARYALDIMAERYGVDLPAVEVPTARRSPGAAAYRHLVRSLHGAARREPLRDLARYGIDVEPAEGAPEAAAGPDEHYRSWRTRCDYRLARHLQRVDEIGAEVERLDLQETASVIGRTPAGRDEADGALLRMVADWPAGTDRTLLELLARRMQRQHMLLGPADSLVVRHPPLQPLPGAI